MFSLEKGVGVTAILWHETMNVKTINTFLSPPPFSIQHPYTKQKIDCEKFQKKVKKLFL